MNVIPSSTGNMLTTLTDGGLQCAVLGHDRYDRKTKPERVVLLVVSLLSKLRRVLRPCQRSWCLLARFLHRKTLNKRIDVLNLKHLLRPDR